MTPNNETITNIMNEGNTFDEAVEIIVSSTNLTTEDVYDALRAEEDREDSEAVYEMETRAENAWLEQAEYDPEAQDEMRREEKIGAFSP